MWYQEVERKEEEEKEEEKDKQWASTLSLEGEQKVSAVKGANTKYECINASSTFLLVLIWGYGA